MPTKTIFCSLDSLGQPYPPVAHEERATNFKKLDVVYYHKPYDAYTVIQAKVPDDWVHLALVSLTRTVLCDVLTLA